MNTVVNRLEEAARVGNVDLLYQVIDEKPDVLEHWDVNQFAQTPLHIAASAGHLAFANEIMRLKPSFALKLNKQGFSPIHLALHQGQTRMAQRFVDINKDLVRVKGREGVTPLHLVSQNGDINMLHKFLLACPDSIQDVTVRDETALHIAVKNRQQETLKILVGWLKINCKKGAFQLERKIMNWQDEEGNTIVHILTLFNDSKVLKWLMDKGIALQAKNRENKTALDIADMAEMKVILAKAGAKHGSSLVDQSSPRRLALRFFLGMTRMRLLGQIPFFVRRSKADMTENERNAILAVATLIAGISFQIVGNPPGGIYQPNNGGGHNNNTSSFNTNDTTSLVLFIFINALVFYTSLLIILFLIPAGRMTLTFPVAAISLSFSFSSYLLRPTFVGLC